MTLTAFERLTTFIPGTRAERLNNEFDRIYTFINGVGRANITQSNSFSPQDVVGFSGGIYTLADASGGPDAVGLVESATTADFVLLLSGVVTISAHGWTLGWNYLSDTVPGTVQASPPPPSGNNFAQAVLFALDGNTVLVRPHEAIGVLP